MYVIPLGFVTVAAAGTPKKLADVLAALQLPADLKVSCLCFAPLTTNTGKAYVGTSDSAPQCGLMNVSTGAGVIRDLLAPASGRSDKVCLESEGGNRVRVADYAVDVQTNGQGFCVYGEVI